MEYFVAVRPDGTDFTNGHQWLPADGGAIPDGGYLTHTRNQLWASTRRDYCPRMEWPCRLLRLKSAPFWPPLRVSRPGGGYFPDRRTSEVWRVMEELPAWEALGPQGKQLERLLANLDDGSPNPYEQEYFAEDGGSILAGWEAAATRTWTGFAGSEVMMGLFVRDLVPVEVYDALTKPWRDKVGPIHPDDPDGLSLLQLRKRLLGGDSSGGAVVLPPRKSLIVGGGDVDPISETAPPDSLHPKIVDVLCDADLAQTHPAINGWRAEAAVNQNVVSEVRS